MGVTTEPMVQNNLYQKEPKKPSLAIDDSFDEFGDLESVLNSFSIDTRKPKTHKRRKSLGMSMKFWKTKDDQR